MPGKTDESSSQCPSHNNAVKENPEVPLAQSLPLEILRTLHAGSMTRWENRREHEWKLNYAIWVALAGLIAGLFLAKDAKFQSPPVHFVEAAGALVILFQIAYLLPITSRGIAEIEMQAEIEHAMRKLDSSVEDLVTEKHFGAGMRGRSLMDKHYGVWAPLGVTVILVFVAAWLLIHPPEQATHNANGEAIHPAARTNDAKP